MRSVFVIDNHKKVRLTLTYPASTGRNFDELLRSIDSLKLTSGYQVATPVDWKHGDDVIIVPSLSPEEAKERFPGGWEEQTPYLRLVPDPVLVEGGPLVLIPATGQLVLYQHLLLEPAATECVEGGHGA